MSGVRRLRFAVVLAIALLVAACGGSDEPTSTSVSPTTPGSTPDTAAVTTTAGSGITATTQPMSTTGAGSSPSSIRDIRGDLGIGSIVLQPADEGGPHPTLAWDPVDGAATYWLVLHDGAGRVYWAWTGAETQVRVGGGDRAELNQTAALHEPMSWSVTAVDASGSLLAFSDVATVSP
jgi:hypothetical protein